jgi:hypothetical protein
MREAVTAGAHVGTTQPGEIYPHQTSLSAFLLCGYFTKWVKRLSADEGIQKIIDISFNPFNRSFVSN